MGVGEIAAGAVISGGSTLLFGIYGTGISYQVYTRGIEIGSQGYFDLPNDFWWP